MPTGNSRSPFSQRTPPSSVTRARPKLLSMTIPTSGVRPLAPGIVIASAAGPLAVGMYNRPMTARPIGARRPSISCALRCAPRSPTAWPSVVVVNGADTASSNGIGPSCKPSAPTNVAVIASATGICEPAS